MQRNDAIRIRIIQEKDQVKQYIADYTPFSVSLVSLSTKEDLEQFNQTIVQPIFSILDSNLFRFTLFQFKDGSGGLNVTFHHLIADAWTMSLFVSEVMELYYQLVQHQFLYDSSNPSYLEYLQTEQEYIKSDKYQKDASFWEETYSTEPEYAPIMNYSSKQSEILVKASRKAFTLSSTLYHQLLSYCKTQNISIYTFLMTIYSIYLSKINNITAPIIGTPILNRTNKKEKSTAGMYISTIPFCVRIHSDSKFSELVKEVSTEQLRIFRHQKYPYSEVLEHVKKKYAIKHNLYDIVVSYQNAKNTSATFAIPYTTEWLFNGTIGDSLEIHFYDMDGTGTFSIYYDYQIAKFTEQDIISIHERILEMISRVLENPEMCIRDLEIVTTQERDTILHTFNATDFAFDTQKPMIEYFEEQVQKHPDKTALVFQEHTYTYAQLNAKANQIAHLLQTQGITKEQVVAVLMERSDLLVISMLGILKAGSVYTLLLPSLPEKRLKYMLDTADVKAVLTTTQNCSIDYPSTLLLDTISLDNYSASNVLEKGSNEDSLSVVYTSGSTGTPKGVLLRRLGMINVVYLYQTSMKLEPLERFLSICSPSFDMFAVEVWLPLLTGKTLFFADTEEEKNPIAMGECIQKNRIEFMLITSSKMDLLLDTPSVLQSVKAIQLGGEVLTPTFYEKVKQYMTAAIFNGYGPTEATACTTTKQITDSSNITIGKPLCNTKVYICNKDGNLCPIGIPGELCIGGMGIAKRYIHNAEATAKSFLPNPFDTGMLYRSGDIACYRGDGEIEYIGRNDFQVKLHGQRIELEEITTALKEIEGIRTAITMLQTVNTYSVICSYYVSEHEINPEIIKAILSKKLPYYMIPSYFVHLTNMPLTANGKVDRKALPEIQIEEKYVAPSTLTEQKLCTIWETLLSKSPISIESNFFTIGGDSLSAIRMITQIEKVFHVKLLVKDIFTNHTIKNLAKRIDSSPNEVEENKPIPKAEKKESYPLSSAQRRIYYSTTMTSQNTTVYNTPMIVRLEGPVDEKRLEMCIQKLIQKHASLRTYFTVTDSGEVVQRIKDTVSFTLPVQKTKKRSISSLFQDFIKPFALEKAPLMHVAFFSSTKNTSYLFLDLHHSIVDGSSVSLLLEELSKLYNGLTLEESAIDYPDFAVWEDACLQNNSFAESKEFWQNELTGELPLLALPTTYQRPETRDFKGNHYLSTIEKTKAQKIKILAGQLHTTPYIILLACYYILLYKYSGQEDIIVASPVSGRYREELKNMVGMFVNSIPIRETISGKMTIQDFILHLSNHFLDCIDHQEYPFDEMVKDKKEKRDASRNPIFDTMFVYQNEGIPNFSFSNINASLLDFPNTISKFDVSLEIFPKESSYSLSFEYATSLFSREYIDNFCKHYQVIVSTVLEDIQASIASISMLTSSEKKKIIAFNTTQKDYAREETIEETFYRMVEQNPKKIACFYENICLSYEDLNQKSNQVANFLVKKGVLPNTIIGILASRTPNLQIYMLGILKAGAGYLLIDPSLPEDRIEYMLTNAQAPFCFIEEGIKELHYPSVAIGSSEIVTNDTQNLPIKSTNENIFCIIYTSGSTGVPKGVTLKRQGILNMLLSYKEILHTDCCERFFSISAVSFDMFIVENFIPLLSGKSVVLSNEEEQKIPTYMRKIILEKQIDFLLTTPSRMELLLSPETRDCLMRLNIIQLGGEVFTPTLYKALREYTNAHLFNGYGPSEITACCSSKEVTSAEDITIGKPFCNTQIYVCNKDKNICPIGVEGEICVVGDGVSLGYVNNPEATKKAFLPNPFGEGVLYATGDIGKLNANGELEYVGRNDFQIKIRGLRVELSEIEKRLLQIPEIKKGTVVYVKQAENPFIAAFYVADETLATSYIRTLLSNSLPLYMVPKYIIPIAQLPITKNGKIDKKALEKYNFSTQEERNYVPPQTPTQKILCEVWEELLHTTVGIDDDIFELGADSLLAIKFKVELLAKNIDITYGDIFKYRTVRTLSEVKKECAPESDTEDYSAIHALLEKNDIRYFQKTPVCTHHNVLLLGSNGFVGMHLLDSFLQKDTGNIYCIVRDKDGIKAEKRFMDILHFYFGSKWDVYLNRRIFVISGSIISDNFGLERNVYENLAQKIDIVVNAAAIVKHYGNIEKFKKINVDSTSKMVQFCNRFHKPLFHISSLSVSGNMSLDGNHSDRTDLTRNGNQF